MASDEEIERLVRRHETSRSATDGGQTLHDYRETASEVHDELARRISTVEDAAAAESELTALAEKLDRIEARLDDLESRL